MSERGRSGRVNADDVMGEALKVFARRLRSRPVTTTVTAAGGGSSGSGSTSPAAPGLKNPMSARGDLTKGGESGAPTRLPVGAIGQLLLVIDSGGGVPDVAWGDAPSQGLDTEAVQDVVGAMLTAGTGIALAYDDAAGTVTITATGGSGDSYTDAQARAAVAAMLLAGAGIALDYDETAGTLTVSATATGGSGGNGPDYLYWPEAGATGPDWLVDSDGDVLRWEG